MDPDFSSKSFQSSLPSIVSCVFTSDHGIHCVFSSDQGVCYAFSSDHSMYVLYTVSSLTGEHTVDRVFFSEHVECMSPLVSMVCTVPSLVMTARLHYGFTSEHDVYCVLTSEHSVFCILTSMYVLCLHYYSKHCLLCLL